MRALTPTLAILVATGPLAGLFAGAMPGDDVAGEYPDAAEIPTDGRRVVAGQAIEVPTGRERG